MKLPEGSRDGVWFIHQGKWLTQEVVEGFSRMVTGFPRDVREMKERAGHT